MKGLILSGGAGTRLRPITHTSAKQLVPIANKPILFYGIEAMAAAGIKEIGIVVGETAEEIHAAVGDGSTFGVSVTYIPQDLPLGLAHCVLIATDFIGGDDFVMYLGDNMLEQGLSEFIERFELARQNDSPPPSAQILLTHVDNPSQFGVAEVTQTGEVVRLIEKPTNPPSDLALVGVYLFDKSIQEAVRSITPSPRGELEITDAIQWLIDNHHIVRHEILSGWWIDTGKKDPLLECNRQVLKTISGANAGSIDKDSTITGEVIIAAGAQIQKSNISGPTVIGENTIISDSIIGPFTSIAAKCKISKTEIDNSVVLENTIITGATGITDSLIGRSVKITKSSGSEPAHRLMLGDHSHVELS